MTDPKVKQPNRIVVSGGPKAEPRLYMAHPKPSRVEQGAKLLAQVVIVLLIIWALAVIIVSNGQAPA